VAFIVREGGLGSTFVLLCACAKSVRRPRPCQASCDDRASRSPADGTAYEARRLAAQVLSDDVLGVALLYRPEAQAAASAAWSRTADPLPSSGGVSDGGVEIGGLRRICWNTRCPSLLPGVPDDAIAVQALSVRALFLQVRRASVVAVVIMPCSGELTSGTLLHMNWTALLGELLRTVYDAVRSG
jgi:hypothetical protein